MTIITFEHFKLSLHLLDLALDPLVLLLELVHLLLRLLLLLLLLLAGLSESDPIGAWTCNLQPF